MTYKIVRSKRKSICISVSAENEITVRCPLKMSEKRIKEFVESKREWLNKVVGENKKKLSINNEIINYKKIYVEGRQLPLILSDKRFIASDAVYIKNLKNIKPLFISHFSQTFIGYVYSLSERYGFQIADIKIKAYKSRWGCCDRKGNITFNFLLFMLPESLQRYVVVHELCHTVFFNHSPDFWKLVSYYEPNYKALRKQLKSFDFIIKLY